MVRGNQGELGPLQKSATGGRDVSDAADDAKSEVRLQWYEMQGPTIKKW